VRGEYDVRSDAGHGGIDIEAWAVACAWSQRQVGLLDGHALDFIALRGQELCEKCAYGSFVIRGGFDVDKPAGKVDRVNRHGSTG